MPWYDLRAWLDDPERLWQRVAVISLAVAAVLGVLAVRQYDRARRSLAQIVVLKELTDGQHRMIREMTGQMDEVRGEMTALMAKLEKLAASEPVPLGPAVSEGEPSRTADGRARTGHSLAADLNRDGIVDWQDFDLFAKDWGRTGDRQGDLHKDRVVDWHDFDIFAGEWLQTEPWYRPKNGG